MYYEGFPTHQKKEMYYEKRPELIKLVEDLHKSYRSLAEKHDQLRFDSTELPPDLTSTPLSSFFKQTKHPHSHITSTRSFQIVKIAPTDSLVPETKAQNRTDSDRGGRRIETWDELRLRAIEKLNLVAIGLLIPSAFLGGKETTGRCLLLTRSFPRKVFAEMPQRNVSSWNALIAGLVNSGEVNGDSFVWEFVRSMRIDGLEPDAYNISSLLPLCGGDAGRCGRELHSCIVKHGFDVGLDSDVHM